MSSSFVKKVKPEWVDAQPIAYTAFGTGKASKVGLRNMYQVRLRKSEGNWDPIVVTEVPRICAPMCRPAVPYELLQSLEGIDLANDYIKEEKITVDLLLGMDYYWKFVKTGVVQVSDGLVALETVFGKML